MDSDKIRQRLENHGKPEDARISMADLGDFCSRCAENPKDAGTVRQEARAHLYELVGNQKISSFNAGILLKECSDCYLSKYVMQSIGDSFISGTSLDTAKQMLDSYAKSRKPKDAEEE